jgi:hypothetical protein
VSGDRAEEWNDPGTLGEQRPLNRLAVVGLVVSTLVAIVGLFALPALTANGLSFGQAFWSLVAIEFLAALGVAVSVLRLRDRGEDGDDAGPDE